MTFSNWLYEAVSDYDLEGVFAYSYVTLTRKGEDKPFALFTGTISAQKYLNEMHSEEFAGKVRLDEWARGTIYGEWLDLPMPEEE